MSNEIEKVIHLNESEIVNIYKSLELMKKDLIESNKIFNVDQSLKEFENDFKNIILKIRGESEKVSPHSLKMFLECFYLDYFNNFATLERFTEYYQIDIELAKLMLEQGKRINHAK